MIVSGLSGGRDSIWRISGALRPWRSSSAAAGAAAPSSRIRSADAIVRVDLVMKGLHHHGDPLPAPDAERGEAETAPSPSKLLGEAEPRPRGPHRLPGGRHAPRNDAAHGRPPRARARWCSRSTDDPCGLLSRTG